VGNRIRGAKGRGGVGRGICQKTKRTSGERREMRKPENGVKKTDHLKAKKLPSTRCLSIGHRSHTIDRNTNRHATPGTCVSPQLSRVRKKVEVSNPLYQAEFGG